jgi:Fe-S-cluster-containing hydrogenase component 2
MMGKKQLKIFSERCIGCRSCELACSLEKGGQSRPGYSRIATLISQDDTVCFPIVCFQCEDVPCAEACPAGAIQRDEFSGVVRIREEDCNGCGQCISACPFGNMLFDTEKEKAKKCDLCEGKPVCLEFCPTHAIEYLEQEEPFLAAKAPPNRFYETLSKIRTKDSTGQ